MYHYTYRIEVNNPTDSRWQYIGVRSSTVKPEEDIYWGSCEEFLKWQKQNGVDKLTKIVLGWWRTREQALKHEILLHDIFDVAANKEFWNNSKQLSTGFDLTGTKQSEEHKNKRRRLGKDHWNYGRKASKETREKMAKSHSGSNNAMYGKPVSDERKKKISEAQKGEKAWRYGNKYPEMGKKLSEMLKGRPKEKTTCPHCNLFGSVNNLKRYHLDNCKAKK